MECCTSRLCDFEFDRATIALGSVGCHVVDVESRVVGSEVAEVGWQDAEQRC